jgi:hypothetical protein
MHLKPDPDAVDFLRKFGLMFLWVIYGAMWVMSYRFSWPSSKHKRFSKRKRNDEPKGGE